MAHLNLAMIHPFSDGNGRLARCLQTLLLAREQIVSPVFSSIEEYLGQNTQAYSEPSGPPFAKHTPQSRSPTRSALTAQSEIRRDSFR